MGLKNCQILLNNPYSVYYAGQIIEGQVSLTLDSSKVIRGIKIRFLGEADVHWNEHHTRTDSNGKRHNETRRFRGHEEYYHVKYYLIGQSSGSEMTIPPGTHTYPFTYQLPGVLPSSFEGEYGYVRHTIKITLDRPWKFDQDFKMAFTVISPIDLNHNPALRNAYTLPLEKTFCCCCCSSGPLSVVTHIPSTGYVPGQKIPIKCECNNASDVYIDKILFKLYKNVAFHSTSPTRKTKYSEESISSMYVGPVDQNDTKSWTRHFEIPPLPPSNLSNCNIIDVNYELKVEACVSGAHMNLEGSIPIVIGTIPLMDVISTPPYSNSPPQYQDVLVSGAHAANSNVGPGGNGGALGWSIPGKNSQFADIPPPTFEQSQRKTSILDHQDSEYTFLVNGNDYSPKYPTYNFPPSAPPL